MKPFNLKAAKAGDPIQCRNGKPARYIAHAPEARDGRSVVALVNNNIQLFFEDGTPFKAPVGGDYDLVMSPKKRTVWVNFYPDGAAEWFESEFEALNCGRSLLTNGRAYPVEIEE